MIDVRAGDFVQLKDIAGAWIDGDCAETESCFYTQSMCEAMKSGEMYRVTSVNEDEDEVYIGIDSYEFIFSFSDIKHVYRIGFTKIM